MNKFFKRMTCAALAALTLANAAVSATAATYDSCYASFTYKGTLCDGSGINHAYIEGNYKKIHLATAVVARYGGAGVNVPVIYLYAGCRKTETGERIGWTIAEDEYDASYLADNYEFSVATVDITCYGDHIIYDDTKMVLDDYTTTNI